MKYILRLTFILVFFASGCTKYLDAVPDKSLTVPTTVADYQALLENETMFVDIPGLGELGSDDLFLPDALWAQQEANVRDTYRWDKDANEGSFSPNWNNSYARVYYSNIVLDGVKTLSTEKLSADLDALKGRALFCRAFAFYDLQEIFGQPFKPVSAGTDLGIPLKLGTDLKEKIPRATVAATFQQIIQDLEEAAKLLPAEVYIKTRNRPGKAAAYALMARAYLVMQNYVKAEENALQCLKLYNKLVDYNTLNQTSRAPFSPLIDEVIYNAIQLNYSNRSWQVDQQLYMSFSSDDLRKALFFTADPVTKSAVFKGYYSASPLGFGGLATDEMYLVIAECEARAGNTAAALDALNTVLIKRFKSGTYTAYTVNTVTDVLTLILSERRKECIFRNLRWSDLRRLNQDPKSAKTLNRVVGGIAYQLPPNDPRYTLPIPDDEIRLSNIPQNIR